MNMFDVINKGLNLIIQILELIPKILFMILGIPGLILRFYFITFPLIFYIAMEYMCYKKYKKFLILELVKKIKEKYN